MRPRPLLAREQRVGPPQALGQPVPGPLAAGIPPVQGKHRRHRHLGPDLFRDAPPVAQGGQDQQHSRAALARSRAAGDHQPSRPQSPIHLMQLAHLARPQPLRPGGGQAGQRREPRRGHRGGNRPGKRGGWPLPPHRNGLRLQQPPLTSRTGPLLINRPGKQVRQPPEFLPGNTPAALAALMPPYPDDPARGDTSRRYGEPREAFQVRAVRRPPHHGQACHGDHRDCPGRGKRPQAASAPTYSQSVTAKSAFGPDRCLPGVRRAVHHRHDPRFPPGEATAPGSWIHARDRSQARNPEQGQPVIPAWRAQSHPERRGDKRTGKQRQPTDQEPDGQASRPLTSQAPT